MTCIVALKFNGKMYMGGDSAGVAGLGLTVRKDPKVFKKDNMLFGYTSSFRMGQIIRYSFKIPEHNKDMSDFEYMCTTFIDLLRKCFKEKGYGKTRDGQDSGGSFLVGYKKEIYKIDNDFQVGINHDRYDACGCGESIALGSMFSTVDEDPDRRIRTALEAAERHSAGVRSPFKLEVM